MTMDIENLRNCGPNEKGRITCETPEGEQVEIETRGSLESDAFEGAFNTHRTRYSEYQEAGNPLSKAVKQPSQNCDEIIEFWEEDGKIVARKRHACRVRTRGEKAKKLGKDIAINQV